MLLTFLASGGGALLGGLLGGFAGWLGALLTSRNARRDQVWKRVEWALTMVLAEDSKAQELGLVALGEIIEGKLADKRDVEIITALASSALGDLEAVADVESADFIIESGDDPAPTGHGREIEETPRGRAPRSDMSEGQGAPDGA